MDIKNRLTEKNTLRIILNKRYNGRQKRLSCSGQPFLFLEERCLKCLFYRQIKNRKILLTN